MGTIQSCPRILPTTSLRPEIPTPFVSQVAQSIEKLEE